MATYKINPITGKFDMLDVTDLSAPGEIGGTTPATVNATTVIADQVKATDGDGLLLTDDGDNGIFVKDGGKVGIGTSDPYGLFTVANNTGNSFIYVMSPTGSSTMVVCRDDDGTQWMFGRPSGTDNFRISRYIDNAYQDVALEIDQSNGYVSIGSHSPSQKLHVKSGHIKVDSGYGIDFSATSDASGMSSEVLDDYEEGTWTPVLSDGTNNATMHNDTIAKYQKVGNAVNISAFIQITSLGSVSGNVRITGLPFTCNSSRSSRGNVIVGKSGFLNITAGNSITGIVERNTSYILLYLWDSTAGTTNLQGSEFSSDGYLNLSATYYVS